MKLGTASAVLGGRPGAILAGRPDPWSSSHRSRQGAQLDECIPEDGFALDDALGARHGPDDRDGQAAAQGHGACVLVKDLFAVAPVLLIWLVADREIEMIQSEIDRPAQQMMQVHVAGAIFGEVAASVARDEIVIRASKNETEACRRNCRADIQTVHFGETRRALGDVEIELPDSRALEYARNTHAGERFRLLIEEPIERALDLFRLRWGDKANLAMFGELLELVAFALAGRSRTFGRIKRIPVLAELGRMRAEGSDDKFQCKERIPLRPDRLRHFLQIDDVEPASRRSADQPAYVLPEREKSLGAEAMREILGEERSVVIAEIGSKPGKPAHQCAALDHERENEKNVAVLAPDHDERNGASARSDLALPGTKPIISLEDSAIGARFERAPFLGHR